MYKPSYMEVPIGFSGEFTGPAAGTVTEMDWSASLWQGYYPSVLQDFDGRGIVVPAESYGAGKCRCYGAVLPLNPDERELYAWSCSAFGLGGAAGVYVVPFFGSVMSNGNNVEVFPRHLAVENVNGNAIYTASSVRGCFRPDPGVYAAWGAGASPCVGVCVVNLSGSSVNVGVIRVSITALRFENPDYGLMMVQ